LSESDRKEIFTRLRKLPVDFLLALINTTAILVIIAAILALIAMVRIDNFAGRMTETVLSKIDLPSKNVLANLRNLTEEIRKLGNTIREVREDTPLQPELARLRETLTALNVSINQLRDTRTVLTEEAIGHLGRAATETLTKMRSCTPPVGQAPSNGNARAFREQQASR
jgi:uncharacterized protein with HEPN domain